MDRVQPHYLGRAAPARTQSRETEDDGLQRAFAPVLEALATGAQTALPIGMNLVSSMTGAGGLGFGPLSTMLGGVSPFGMSSDFAQQMQLLQVQRQMQQEQQVWNLVSNVEKARHEAAMALVRNVRP